MLENTLHPLSRLGVCSNLNKVDLLFVGDSITHWFRKMPWHNEQTCGMNVWRDHYVKRNAANTGIMADKTQHVLWRFKNRNLKNIQPKLAVVMIGTNNVAYVLGHPHGTLLGYFKLKSTSYLILL